MKKSRFSDLMVGVVTDIFAVAVIIAASRLPEGEGDIGPGGFPTFIAAVLLLLGSVMIVKAIITGIEKPRIEMEKKVFVKLLIFLVSFAIYIKLLPILGFLIATILMLNLLFWLFEYNNHWKALLISVLFTLTVWLIFTKAFMVFLPRFTLF